jgi:hypothetical protein
MHNRLRREEKLKKPLAAMMELQTNIMPKAVAAIQRVLVTA